MIEGIGTGTSLGQNLAKADSPAKIRDAAQQFEALMIAQLLKSSHGESGWLGTGEDQAGVIGIDMAEQEFARMLTAAGGLGISKMIVAGLESASDRTQVEHVSPGRTDGQRQPAI